MKKIFFVLLVFTFLISCSSNDDENCDKPKEFTLITVDENFALFHYLDKSLFSVTVVEYGEPGFELGVNAIGTNQYSTSTFNEEIRTHGHLLTGLQPNSEYEAYIKLQCFGEAYSKYTGPITFTTLAFGEGCTQPESLVALETTESTILINWEGHTNKNWEVEIVYNTEDDMIEEVKYLTTENPFLIENLLPDTTYNIIVSASLCNDYVVSGMSSNKITVVTDN